MGGRRTSEKSGWGPIDTSPSSSSANGCTKVGWEERREEGGRTTCVKIDFRSCYSIPPFLFLNLRNSQTFRLEKGGDHHYVSNRRLPIFFSRKEKKVNLLSLFSLPVPFRKSSPMLRVVRFSLPAIGGEGAIS